MLLPFIFFLAAFTQGAAGFGMALVSMPLLVGILGIRTATPLVALVGAVLEIFMLARYRHAFEWRAVIRLAAASLFGIPLGIYVLRRVDADFITRLLGVVILGYALYALLGPALPELRRRGWAYGFGFVAGLLSGAYNTPGPPVVIYGSCRRWPPAVFKSNLQGYFLLNTAVVLLAHGVSGNLTPQVWRNFWIGLPFLGLGLLAGVSTDRWLNPDTFRRIIQVLLIFLGLRLLIG